MINSMEWFDRYAADYIANFHPAPNTLRAKRVTISHFLKWCDKKGFDWRNLNSGQLLEFIGSGGWSSRTQELHKTRIKHFYDWAVDAGHSKKNPAAVPFRPTRTPPRAAEKSLMEWEVKAMLNAVPFMDDVQRFVLLYSISRPVRMNELAQLKAKDVDMRTRVLRIGVSSTTKNGKARWHTIPQRVMPILDRLLDGLGPEDPVLGFESGHIFVVVRKIFKIAGVKQEGRAGHAFRHYVINKLLHEKGLSAGLVAEMSGNSPSTLMAYYCGKTPQHQMVAAMASVDI